MHNSNNTTAGIDWSFLQQANAVILTPNRRLAAFLEQQASLQQLAVGNLVWHKPAIYPINSWFTMLWQDLAWHYSDHADQLLTDVAEQIIWEKIIVASTIGANLLEVSATATQAINAWHLLLQWDLNWQHLAHNLTVTQDFIALQEWITHYQQLCNNANLLDFYSMLNKLLAVIPEIAAYLPQHCYLVAHQELSPQYRKIFNSFATIGMQIHEMQLTAQECANITVLPAATSETEYHMAAQWAHNAWQANPNARIGIVVPELARDRDKLTQIFAKYFKQVHYNISAPKALIEYRIIDLALLLIRLVTQEAVQINDLSKILYSTYIDLEHLTLAQRSSFAAMLMNTRETAIPRARLAEYLAAFTQQNQLLTEQVLALQNIITSWPAIQTQLRGKARVEFWLEQVQAWLTLWGWPGNNITATEHAILICWQTILQTYLQLDFILAEHDFFTVWRTLEKLTFLTPFLPEAKDQPIQVLGVLEAAGLPFDKLWLAGMHSVGWPTPAAPNPFLPLHWQRQFKLPRSSANRELMVAKQLTAAFCKSAATQFVLSFPQSLDDFPVTASRLIATLTRGEQYQPNQLPQNSAGSCLNNTALLESVIELNGPKLSNNIIPGGSNALSLQANCPFRAYSEIRLQARSIEASSIGLTAAERGIIVHQVLADFWGQVRSYHNLVQMTPSDIAANLSQHIAKVLNALQQLRPLTLQPNYMALEADRTLNLLTKWLSLEQQRQPFIVYQLEQECSASIAGSVFKLRLDRVDQLLTGEIVIIDYKTGTVAPQHWFTPRLQEPQVPLYCVATLLKPQALAFALIRPDVLQFKGVAASEDLLPDLKILPAFSNAAQISWQEQLITWQQQLESLALEIQQGLAIVQPVATTTCNTCKLQSVCRIYEKQQQLCNN